MICKNCKTTLPDDSMFCPSCGQKVEAEHVVASDPTFISAFRKAGNLDGSDSGIGAPVVERKSTVPKEDTGLRFSSGFKRADSTPVEEPTATSATPEWADVSGGAYSDPEVHNTKNRCQHCGVPMNPNAVFCSSCGKKLGESLSKKFEKKLTGIKLLNTHKSGVIVVASITLVFVIAVSLLALCFGAPKVPDSILDRFVRESKYYDNKCSMSWAAKHDFDKSANIDTVLITLTAKGTYGQYTTSCTANYQYNSAAKNWTLLDSGKWSGKEYTFNDKLKRSWSVTDFGKSNSYTFKVTSVSKNSISFDYSIKYSVSGGWLADDKLCEMSGKTTVQLKPGVSTLDINIPLPNGFFATKGQGLGGARTNTPELSIWFAINEGIYMAMFYDQIHYSNNNIIEEKTNEQHGEKNYNTYLCRINRDSYTLFMQQKP